MNTRLCIWTILLAAACGSLSAATDFVANSIPPAATGFIHGIVVDPNGNRYVTGFFAGTFDFNPGIGADERTSVGGSGDVFISRYNADGTYAWTQVFGGSDLEFAHDIAVNGGVVYVVGSFQSNDAFLGTSGPIPNPGGGLIPDAFVLAVDAATGAPVLSFNSTGVQTMGGTGFDEAFGVTAGGGSVFVGGDFSSSNFGVGALGAGTAVGGSDGFIAALNATTGAPLAGFGGNGYITVQGDFEDAVEGLTIAGGSVYAVGETSSTMANVGGVSNFGSNAPGSNNAFVFRMSPSTGALDTAFNSPIGVTVFGGNGDDIANFVRVANSTVYVAGSFRAQDAGFNALNGFAAVGNSDAFVLALSETTGLPVMTFGNNGLKQFGGGADDTATRLDFLGSTIYVTGFFSSIDAGFGTAGPIASTGADDAFVLALDGNTGAPLPTFSGDGIQTFSGTGSEQATGIAVTPTQVIIAGTAASLDNGVGGLGTITTVPFFGFILPLDAVNGSFNQPPPPGGGDGTNIAEGDPALVNPLTGIAIKVLRSAGGFVLLDVDVNSLNRAPVSPFTDFDDIPGRGASNVPGKNPSHQFTQPGVFISTTRAVEQGTNAEKGKMRKTLALSAKETGESGASVPPPSPEITVKGMKGKFLFSKSTPDQVSFSGTIMLPAGLDLSNAAGQQLSIGVGNITDNVVIDPKGKGKLPSEKNRIKSIKVKYPRLPKGQTTTAGGEVATVTMTYSTADMDLNGFDTEGITTTFAAGEDGTKGVARNIQVAMVLSGASYEALAPVTFKVSKKGDAGTMSRTSR